MKRLNHFEFGCCGGIFGKFERAVGKIIFRSGTIKVAALFCKCSVNGIEYREEHERIEECARYVEFNYESFFINSESTDMRHKSRSRTLLNDIITPNFKKFLQIYEILGRNEVDLHYFNL